MTSYVFTILEKYHWDKVYQSLTNKLKTLNGACFENSNPEKMKFCSLQNLQRVSVLVFEDSKTENEMISETVKVVQGHEMVLCRDYFDYKTVFSDYMLEMGLQGAQVVVYRKIKKSSKLKSFFDNLYNKMIKKVFGFRLYGAEVGLMYFNNIALSVLKELPNNVTLTKVNKWAGFEVSYIDIESETISEAIEKVSPNQLKLAIASATILALLVAGFVLLAVFKN